MAIDLELFETDDSTPAVSIVFGTLGAGSISATFTKHLWNGLANPVADLATGLSLTVYERQIIRDPDTLAVIEITDWNQTGRATIERWVQARYTNADGVTNWVPIGKGRWLALDDLAAEEFWAVEFRKVVPGGAISSEEREFRIVTSWESFSQSVDLGHHESGRRGILSGVGDGASSHLVSGYDATPNGTPDNTVDFSDGVAIISGIPYVDLLHTITLDGNDGAAAALTTGNEYWATISKGGQAGLIETKSAQGAAPLANSLRPAVPTGEEFVAYVRRHFDAVIEAGDIFQDTRFHDRFSVRDLTTTTLTLNPGSALVDNRICARTGVLIATLTDDAVNTIWLDPLTAGLFVTTGTNPPPVDRSLPLWQITLAAGVETLRVDLRSYIGPREITTFTASKVGALVDEEVLGYHYHPPGRSAYIRTPLGINCSVGTTGDTSGQTVFDLEYSTAGGAWTTVFTSFASEDRRPTIDFDATDPVDSAALPEVVEIPGNTRLRWRVVDIPTGVASNGAVAVAILELP